MTHAPTCEHCQSAKVVRLIKQEWDTAASAWRDVLRGSTIRCSACGAWQLDRSAAVGTTAAAATYLRGLRDARQVALDHMMAYGFAIAAKVDVMINRAASIPLPPTEP